MADPRLVVERRRQLTIALPPSIARVVEARAGATLYWHRHRGAEVVLSRLPVRKGGPPGARTDAKRIRELEREVDKLRARLARQRESIWNEYRAQEVGRRIHLELKGYPALDAINDRLRAIQEALSLRPLPRPRRPRQERLRLPPGVVAIDLDPPDTGDDGAPRSMEAPSPAPPPSG